MLLNSIQVTVSVKTFLPELGLWKITYEIPTTVLVHLPELTFACFKSTIETVEKNVKYVQS